MLRPISYPEQAREVVRHLIFNGTYQPGQKLKEVELSKVLGISRSPIREALQTLANEGIVDLIPNRGAFVVSFDLGEVEELFAVREALEALGVRLAVER